MLGLIRAALECGGRLLISTFGTHSAYLGQPDHIPVAKAFVADEAELRVRACQRLVLMNAPQVATQNGTE
jgi:hypothetical protein